MTLDQFVAGAWVERLAQALPGLAEAQKPFLEEYWRYSPREHVEVNGQDVTPYPTGDLRHLYALAHHGRTLSGDTNYAPLCAAMDSVRGILRSHPTLERVLDRIIGDDDFWVQILGHGGLTSLTDLIAGLMARADELPKGGFRAAARELHAFLDSAEGGVETAGLDTGYDTMLFHGLHLKEEIDIGDGLTMLPFECVRAFVDENVLSDMVPDVVRFRDWRLVGAVVRPFQWKPEFRVKGDLRETNLEPPGPFGRDMLEFLELLAVSHRVPIVYLAAIRRCLNRSACHLLGQGHNNGGLQRGHPVHRFDSFAAAPQPRAEALAEAREAFVNRRNSRYRKLAPIVVRLAAALARDERLAAEDRILDVAIALEGMYDLGGSKISQKLRTRASWFLGEDVESRLRVLKSVTEFYRLRSEIVHNRKRTTSLEKYRAVFDMGFDIAGRTLFRLLHDGPPGDWEELVIAGE